MSDVSNMIENESEQEVVLAPYTHGPIMRMLIKMSLSMLIGFVAGAAFNVTDTYFVSRLGTESLAAMGFTLPVVMVVFGLTMGIGIGGNSAVARAIGRNQTKDVTVLTISSLTLGLIFVGIIVTVGLFTMRPLFTLLGANEQTLPLVTGYMRIWYLGVMFLVIPVIGNNLIRATGDMLTPAMIMAFDICLNIILDPILIFGLGPFPEMGIRGAAVATLFARAIALIVSLHVLIARKKILRFEKVEFREVVAAWKEILHTGFPVSLAHFAMPVGMGVVLAIASKFGNSAVAAISAGSRIEQVAVIPILAVGSSLIPFAGQNWGAKKLERIREATSIAIRFCLLWGAVCVLVLALTASKVASVFATDSEVASYLTSFLFIVPIAFGLRGLSHNSCSVMNGIKHPYHSSSLVFIRIFLILIPMAFVGTKLFGFRGLLISFVATDLIAGVMAKKWLDRSLVKARAMRTPR